MTKLPTGWRWVKLSEVSEIIAGQSPPGNTYIKEPKGLPFFQGKADFGPKYPIARTWCIAPIKIAQPGDILISVRAPVGPTNIADVECCIGRGLSAIRPNTQTDRDFILFALKLYKKQLADLGSGSTFSAITQEDLRNLEIPLPPLDEQHRIVAILNEKMAAIEQARAAAEAQLKAAQTLPTAYLREVFDSAEAERWPKKRLGDVNQLLPARSVALAGDTDVNVITTGCLTETGFNPNGIKLSKMWSYDVAECVVSKGEILIARSNTTELVGRVAMFDGIPPDVVASDLTIRVWPCREKYSPSFLTSFLSYLYLNGYWRDRAGGASQSMKKITRGMVSNIQVPTPDIEMQQNIVDLLNEKINKAKQVNKNLQSQLDTINTLPAALLRQAFKGEL